MNKPEPYEYLEAFISREAVDRLARLSERIGKSEDDVIEAALKLYEDGLNAVDEGRKRCTSMSFEVFSLN